ncbi:MAG: hypothetical protein J2P28_22345 [Actinobacteria bacterium]|nr:hypothetical protein [Actinomycetota bacterium]MBO0838237.1 hypothetical protein [Actinomycetota bacterium]
MGTRGRLLLTAALGAGLLFSGLLLSGLLSSGLVFAYQGSVGAGVAAAAPAQAVRLVASAGHGNADRLPAVSEAQPQQPSQLPDVGFDGVAVAAIGTGLTGAGWLLMMIASRRLRRRSR